MPTDSPVLSACQVGSVDGTRLWSKELKLQLSHVAWSPSGRSLLFGTLQCEVHLYDASGNYLSQLPLYCLDDASVDDRALKTPQSRRRLEAQTTIIGLDWYDGAEGVRDSSQPTLAIGVENGRLQLMRNEQDEAPVLIDTGLTATTLKWATDGSVLALAGTYSGGGGGREEVAMVQFYSPFGQHLCTLKVPGGGGIQALSWEGGGSLRVALAVDTVIYFANIRPAATEAAELAKERVEDHKWGYFGDAARAHRRTDALDVAVTHLLHLSVNSGDRPKQPGFGRARGWLWLVSSWRCLTSSCESGLSTTRNLRREGRVATTCTGTG